MFHIPSNTLLFANGFPQNVYYRENFQLPELPDPPKLFRVQRVRRLKSLIYWERKILQDLDLIYYVCIS